MKNNDYNTYDIIIIGAGVIGCAIAREMSKYQGRILLIEKDNDVSSGASKANSGIVHGGYDAKYGTLKGFFSRKGNLMFPRLNEELNFGYKMIGSLVLAFSDTELEALHRLKENGLLNGVDDLEILDRSQILDMEPHVNPQVKYALYCPSAGVASPYEMTIALAENAIENGVDLRLKQEVIAIEKKNGNFMVSSSSQQYHAKYIINAAGYFSDRIANMLGLSDFTIHPRKGEYILLNKNQGHLANHVLFQTPSEKGKGILVTPTFHGNLMLGPNSQSVDDLSSIGTEQDILAYIVETARHSVPNFDIRMTLTSFAGLRATSSKKDFIIEESRIPGFINVAGIESPGLTSSPSIAVYISELLSASGYDLKAKKDFNPYRTPILQKKDPTFKGTIDDIDPSKNIICRCEQVTEAEIVDALHRGIHIDHIDGIKRRTRCTMGPCQGHFCTSRVRKIIAREMNLPEEKVVSRGVGSLPLPKREDRTFWKRLD